MSRPFVISLFAVAVFLALPVASAPAQYIGIGTPFHSLQDDFFERIGIGFGFSLAGGNGKGVVGFSPGGFLNAGGNIVFSQGGFNSAIPTFGGYDPNTDATAGVGLLKGGNGMFLNLAASQGSTRSMIGQVPSVVIPNGGTGTFSDSSMTPFVTGIIPVVGDAFVPPYYPTRMETPSPLQERLQRYQEQQRQGASARRAAATARATAGDLPKDEKPALKLGGGSSADRGDLSVAEIKKQQAAADAAKDKEVQGFIERGRGAEEAGKTNVAKIYYRQALTRASGSLRDELQVKIDSLGN